MGEVAIPFFPSKHPILLVLIYFFIGGISQLRGGTGADWETGKPIHGRIENLLT